MADYDGDGLTDLISGSSCCRRPDCFYVFLRQKDGGFGPRRQVNLPGMRSLALLNGLRSKVAVADWNGDGVPDVIVGGDNTNSLGVAYGPLAGKENLTLQPVSPDFEQPFQRMTTNPCVADWDDDGLADLLVGGYRDHRTQYETRGIYWLRNVGTKREPELAEPELLIADQHRLHTSGWRWYTDGICVADYNGDGRPDLIASQRERRVTPPKYENRQYRLWVYLRAPR